MGGLLGRWCSAVGQEVVEVVEVLDDRWSGSWFAYEGELWWKYGGVWWRYCETSGFWVEDRQLHGWWDEAAMWPAEEDLSQWLSGFCFYFNIWFISISCVLQASFIKCFTS